LFNGFYERESVPLVNLTSSWIIQWEALHLANLFLVILNNNFDYINYVFTVIYEKLLDHP